MCTCAYIARICTYVKGAVAGNSRREGMCWQGPKLNVWSPLAAALSTRGAQTDGMGQLRPGIRRRAQIVVFDAFSEPCVSPLGPA